MSYAGLGWRLLRREWAAGELRLLVAALVVAVAAVSSVAWLAERVGAAGTGRVAELLAADRVLRSDDAIPEAWVEEARARGLSVVRTHEFPSVVLAGERDQLASVKAVEDGYPLRGEVEVHDPQDGTMSGQLVPPPGEAWLERRLAAQLDIAPGEQLTLGVIDLTFSAELVFEPDRGGPFGGFAPRLMFNHADLEATQLVQPASRVQYALLLAGPESALDDYRNWLEARSDSTLDWLRPGDEQPAVQGVMANAERFLGLGALLTVVIAGVAMLLTVRRYAMRQLDPIAVMRCLGGTQRQMASILAWKLIWLGLAGGALGVLLGLGLQQAMLALVADLLPPRLPAPGWGPALSGWLTALAALLGFAMPTVLRLRAVPPLRVLRRDLGGEVLHGSGLYVFALVVIFGLMWWRAGEFVLAAIVFTAVLGGLTLLAAAGALVVWSVRVWRRRGRGGLLVLAGIARRPWTAVVQIVGVGVGLMALMLLALISDDLLDEWRASIPEDAPNYFLVNVQPAEVDEVRAFLDERGVATPTFYPMIRGRLTHVNGRAVAPEDYEEPSAQRLVAREFNLSWTAELYPENEVVAGSWWSGGAPAEQFSIEEGLAEQLGLTLGDRLTFRIAGEPVSATVTNLRSVRWDSFNVNFFVVGPPALLQDYPTTYISSFYLPPDDERPMLELMRDFPSLSVLDVEQLLETARDIMAQGGRVVELMALLTLAAGVLVLLAALRVSAEERRFESALLRALGAKRRRIRRLARAEFLLLGAVSGLIAALLAMAAAHVVARAAFELHYVPDPMLPVFGVLIGALLVWAAGALGTRRSYRVSPMRLLGEASND